MEEGQKPVSFGKIPSGTKAVKKRDWSGDNARWYIQEKVDGSQLSFCLDAFTGELRFFNRGKEKVAPYQKVFLRTITALQARLKNVDVDPDLVFHGEAVGSRKHNVTVYQRVPRYGFVLFGAQRGTEYLNLDELRKVATRYDLELVHVIYENKDENLNPYEKISKLMETRIESALGGEAEGLVLKHPAFVKPNGAISTSKFKFVYPQFKEVHRKKQKKAVSTPEDFLHDLVSWFNQDAWMSKAVFRLRDNGVIDPDCKDEEQRRRDRVRVQREMARDITEECADLLREELWQFFGPLVVKRVVKGAVEKYAE